MKLRRLIEVGIGLAIGGTLLFLVLRNYPWQALGQLQLRWEWFGLAGVVMALAHLIRAWRWSLFLRQGGEKVVGVREAFMALMAGYLVNLGLPRAGEAVRCVLLYRSRHLPLDVSIGTVVGERVLDVIFLGVWATGVVSVEGAGWLERLGLWQWLPLLTTLGVAGMALLWAVYRYRTRLPQPWVQRLIAGITSAFTLKPLLLNLALSGGIWVCYWIGTWMAGLAVEGSFALWTAWVLLVGSGLAMALPVPGGIGTFHLVGYVLLGFLGYADTPAKTLVLLIHAFQTLHTLILGLGGMAYFVFQPVGKIKAA